MYTRILHIGRLCKRWDSSDNLNQLKGTNYSAKIIHTMLGSLLRLRYLVELIQLVLQAHDWNRRGTIQTCQPTTVLHSTSAANKVTEELKYMYIYHLLKCLTVNYPSIPLFGVDLRVSGCCVASWSSPSLANTGSSANIPLDLDWSPDVGSVADSFCLSSVEGSSVSRRLNCRLNGEFPCWAWKILAHY